MEDRKKKYQVLEVVRMCGISVFITENELKLTANELKLTSN